MACTSAPILLDDHHALLYNKYIHHTQFEIDQQNSHTIVADQRGLKMADHVGQQFGDYCLTRFLGRGSFGDVYLGEHVHDNTLAAIKVLQARLTSEDLKEFINEVSTTFRLQHPNIVRLLDFGIGADDTPFLAMDYAPKRPRPLLPTYCQRAEKAASTCCAIAVDRWAFPPCRLSSAGIPGRVRVATFV